MVSDQGAAWGIYSKAGHAFAKTIPEAAAYAVRGGLDLEDTDTPADSVLHQGLPGAVAQGLLSESDIDRSVSRLMYVISGHVLASLIDGAARPASEPSDTRVPYPPATVAPMLRRSHAVGQSLASTLLALELGLLISPCDLFCCAFPGTCG